MGVLWTDFTDRDQYQGGPVPTSGGNNFEEDCVRILEGLGFSRRDGSKWVDGPSLPGLCRRIVVTQVPHPGLYGQDSTSDFLILAEGNPKFRVLCEAKWQQSSGSVDQKFPYMVEDAKLSGEANIMFVIDGRGFRSGAIAWLKRKCAESTVPRMKVFDYAEFRAWAYDTFAPKANRA